MLHMFELVLLMCSSHRRDILQNDEKDKLRASLGNAIMVERPDVKVSLLCRYGIPRLSLSNTSQNFLHLPLALMLLTRNLHNGAFRALTIWLSTEMQMHATTRCFS